MSDGKRKNSAGPARAKPSRQQRKEARPAEIVAAALGCFLEKGFETTKIEDVARRAGVAKGTIYVYFENKEHLFRAVVREVTAAHLVGMESNLADFSGSFAELLPELLGRMINTAAEGRAPAVVQLILRESSRVPDLAAIWFEDAVQPLLTLIEGVIRRAQDRGELCKADPRSQIVSIFGPMVVAALLDRYAVAFGKAPIDLQAFARDHATSILAGILAPRAEEPKS